MNINKNIDFFPIFSTIFLFISCVFTMSYLRESYGQISLIISICYIIATFFSFFFLKKEKFLLHTIILLIEYFLIMLIPFKFDEVLAKKEFLSLYFSFGASLVSLKLLDEMIIKKIQLELKCNFAKSKKLSSYSIIFILLCLYPITLSILATSFFYNKDLILAPVIIFLYFFCIKKFQSVKTIKYVKCQRALIFIFPLILLYLTSLFFKI